MRVVEAVQTPTTTLSVLGPLAVTIDRRPVVVAGYRRRALLARLALGVGAPVTAERLADDLWEDDPLRRSLPTLRTYVAKLRNLLPSGSDLLVSSPAGYTLALAPDAFDAFRFEQLLAEPDDDLIAADRNLDAALALWRGSALEEFADLQWARVEANRLEELRLLAQERFIDVQLALGRHADVVPTLGALTAAHPLRERFHEQYSIALYRSGRQADALDAQRRARAMLLHELGLEPGPQLAGLEHQLLVHDASLAAPRDATPHVESRTRPSHLPSALRARRGDPAFVGRTGELAVVAAALEEVRGVGCRLVVVNGDPGIGKTRLAAEAAAAALERRATVLYGRCDDGLGVPYQPFVEALKEFAARAPLDTLAADLGSDPGALVSLAPELASHLPVGATIWGSPDPAAEQHRLFDAVASWLDAVAASGPVLVVLDDMQWATRSTAMLTQHVVRALRDRPVLLLATVLSNEAAPDNDMASVVTTLRRERAAEVISLTGLDSASVAALVAAERGPDAVDRLAVEQLRDATAGSPLLITELARHATRLDEEVPATVRDMLLPRVVRLSPATRGVVRAASVVGLEFELRVVAGALGEPEDDTLTALDEAVAAGLLHELDGATGRYAFAHAILLRTVYESQGATRRAHLHRAVARALETVAEVQPDLVLRLADDIAHHWQHAGASHAEDAAAWCARAGRQALRQFAYDDAVRHLGTALRMASNATAAWRGAVLLDLAAAHAKNGDAATAREALLDAALLARSNGDVIALAHAALGSAAGGRGVSEWIADELRTTLLAEAYATLPEDERELRVGVAGALALALYLPDQRARRQALAREAVDLAQRDGSPALLAAGLPASRVRYWRPTDGKDRLAYAREVLRIAERDGDPWLEASALDWIVGDTCEAGDRVAFDQAAARCHTLASQVGGLLLPWRASVIDAHVAVLRGDLAEAERLSAAALTVWGDDPAPDAVQTFGYQLGVVRLLQGRGEETVALCDQALAMWPAAYGIHAPRAYSLALAGRHDEAADEVAWCAADDLDAMPQDSGWLLGTILLAEAASITRQPAAIEALRRALAPHAERFGTLAGPCLSWGTAAHQLGALALASDEPELAITHLAQACRLERSFGAVPWLARSHSLLARARRSVGDDAAADADDAAFAAIAATCPVVAPI